MYIYMYRLRALYAQDEKQYRAELEALDETTEQRHERLRKKALALREQNQAYHQAQVQEKLYEQWKDGCDELRALKSHNFLQAIVAERKRQSEEGNGVKQREAEGMMGGWTY